MSHFYFGGSRTLSPSSAPLVSSVVNAVAHAGHSVHVGCQRGADAQVILSCPAPALSVFAVAPSVSVAPFVVRGAVARGARVTFAAGGSSAPMPARFLLRSIAAFTGCAAAVFFAPGVGSLAVAREATARNLPVFVFSPSMPAPIPATAGSWQPAQFFGFACWQFVPAQQTLF